VKFFGINSSLHILEHLFNEKLIIIIDALSYKKIADGEGK